MRNVPWQLGGLLCTLLWWSFSCKKQVEQITPAFYHWQTQFALQADETTYLNQLGCRYLYVKFLDIARNDDGAIQPYSLLDVLDTAGLADKTIIPCIFITNSVFQDISEKELDWLAQKTALALSSVGAQFPQPQFEEIQFDCDWTGSTRAAFFSYLKKMRLLLAPDCRLSATIRLHQYKFPDRTGVPPVDRGMLMFYNTGAVDDPSADNSIFQTADAEKYVYGAPANYALPLDLVLPVFSWALVYRDARLWKIVPEPDLAEFRDTSRFQSFSTVEFLILQRTFLGEHYLRPGDLVRLEVVDTALLRQAAQLAKGVDLAPNARLAFYHLDTAVIRRSPAVFLKKLCATFQAE